MKLSYNSRVKSRPFLVLPEDRQKTHTAAKTFSCSECDKVFSLSKYLKGHHKNHSGDIFACSQCNKSFSGSGSLKSHQRIHTGEKLFGCSDCNQTFSYSSTFRNIRGPIQEISPSPVSNVKRISLNLVT